MIDDPTDYAAEIRALKRRIRQLETRNPFAAASITRGSGIRLALAGGIHLDGPGTITAGPLTVAADGSLWRDGVELGAASGAAQAQADYALVEALAARTVANDGRSRAMAAQAQGDYALVEALAARTVANDGRSRAIAAQAQGDYGLSEALAARAVANQAYAWGQAAATSVQLAALANYVQAVNDYASSIQFWFNKHMDDYHGGGGKSPGNPPVMG